MAKIISFPAPKKDPWNPSNPLEIWALYQLAEKGVTKDGEKNKE